MAKDRQIQIPESLFVEICKYVLMPEYATEADRLRIEKGICDKIDRMQEHDLYTKYKTAPTDEQKEQARREYIERKGIPASFRW